MMDVSIIIVNYNTSGLVSDAIASVYKRTEGLSFEIIVVDNNSKEDCTFIKERYPDVTIIKLKENIGFGRANNEGLKTASGRNIFLLNPDTILENNAVKILSDFLDCNIDAGVCGANLHSKNGEPIHSFLPLLPSPLWDLNTLLFNAIFRLKKGKNFQYNFTGSPMKVGYITGADMMIKHSVLNEVGGFDPDFFMYYEETELSYRIRKAGYHSYSVPDAEIIHLEGQSIKTSDKREELKRESKRLYYEKTQSKFNYILSNTILKISCDIRFVLYRITGEDNKAEYWRTIYNNI